MTVGIDKTLATFKDVTILAVDGIALAKKGSLSLGSLAQIFGLISDLQALVKDAPLALPELSDLDAVEAGAVGSAAFSLVKAVLGAIAA